MQNAASHAAPRFVRRTHLREGEYHTNFRKLDCETIARLTSPEAARVTPQMSRIYLLLVTAPAEYWEREGVLRFAGEERAGEWVTAWRQLVSLLGVAPATALKALRWMHGEGIVGYFAGKNGVGIRVFLNRAASSVGRGPRPGQKNLRLVPASGEAPRASTVETPFKDSSADLEVLEKDSNPRAPESGAERSGVDKTPPAPQPAPTRPAPAPPFTPDAPVEGRRQAGPLFRLDELVLQLRRELEPSLQAAARQAAAREHERTREWLESRGLPKAARVAQRETYNLLRHFGLAEKSGGARAGLGVGRQIAQPETGAAGPPPPEELRELAEACAAMLEVHGQAVEATLAGLGAGAGGRLSAGDAARVRELAEALAGRAGEGTRGGGGRP